jgi:fructose-1,6-bisphosphatase/inositol monophosphatase family enzyme
MTAPAADATLMRHAVDLAREAGQLTLEGFRTDRVVPLRKGDGSTVTETDLAVERFLRERIEADHPDDAIVGEELPDRPGTSGRTWVLDPVDGTESYARGVVTYSTMVAVLDEHGPAIGVICSPAVGETVWAGRGMGCWWDDRPARVSERTEATGSFVATSDQEDWPLDAWLEARRAGVHVRDWGNAYGVGLVVTGRIDAFVDYGLAVWDIAPMPVLATEAGGRYSALDGTERLDGRIGLVSNGAIHDELLSILRMGVRDIEAEPTWSTGPDLVGDVRSEM